MFIVMVFIFKYFVLLGDGKQMKKLGNNFIEVFISIKIIFLNYFWFLFIKGRGDQNRKGKILKVSYLLEKRKGIDN